MAMTREEFDKKWPNAHSATPGVSEISKWAPWVSAGGAALLAHTAASSALDKSPEDEKNESAISWFLRKLTALGVGAAGAFGGYHLGKLLSKDAAVKQMDKKALYNPWKYTAYYDENDGTLKFPDEPDDTRWGRNVLEGMYMIPYGAEQLRKVNRSLAAGAARKLRALNHVEQVRMGAGRPISDVLKTDISNAREVYKKLSAPTATREIRNAVGKPQRWYESLISKVPGRGGKVFKPIMKHLPAALIALDWYQQLNNSYDDAKASFKNLADNPEAWKQYQKSKHDLKALRIENLARPKEPKK